MSVRAETQAPVAMSGRVGFPFRRVFPLGQLVLCAIVLWPARGILFLELGLPARFAAPPILLRFGSPMLERLAQWSNHYGTQTVTIINLPAAVSELLVTMVKNDWPNRPWRAISCPILGMIFWWIAGRGADALVATRRKNLAPRIGWVETMIGFLLLAAGATMTVGIEFFSGSDRHDLQPAALVSAMWAFLGGLSVAAKVVQWRLRRHLVADHAPGGIPTTLSAGGPAQ
jgi:hypothetical protein